MELVADSIRRNIRDTIMEQGGDPDTIAGYRKAGWKDEAAALRQHHGEAWILWLQFAPKTMRESHKLLARFEKEWPAIMRLV